MARRDAFVTEVAVDFEYAIETAHHQTFQIEFRRDAQVHINVERVVMGDERTRGGAAWDHLHHRRFHFHKVAAHHELADAGHDLGANAEGFARLFVGDQIEVALTIARFLIGQAVKFIRQRTQRFGQQAQFGAMDREFAGFGFEQFAARTEDVAQVPLFKLFVVNAFRQVVARHVKLDAAADVLQRYKRRLAHNAARHHTTRHADFDIQRFQLFVAFLVILRVQLFGDAVAAEIVRERHAMFTQRAELFTTRFQFVIKFKRGISALRLLFRHVGSL